MEKGYAPLFGAGFMCLVLWNCTPTVRVEAPADPIRIDMHIKIEQEVRVRVDRDLEREFAANPEIFGVSVPVAGQGK